MRALLTGIVALLGAGPLAAQSHHHAGPTQAGQTPLTSQCPHPSAMSQGHMMPGMMQQGADRSAQMGMTSVTMPEMMDMALMDVMHQAMVFAPGRVLQLGDQLQLSTHQHHQIQELANEWSATSGEMGMGKLKELLNADSPDVAAVRAAAENVLSQHAATQADHVAAAVAVRTVLTADQLDQVRRSVCDAGPSKDG